MVCLKELYASVFYSLLILPDQIWSSGNHGQVETSLTDQDFRWSAWNEFSPCSRSCGVGIKRRTRTCYRFGRRPITPVGSELCRGEVEQHRTCNIRKCPDGALDFRSLQCAFFNGLNHNNQRLSWKPFITGHVPNTSRKRLHPCSLVCSAVDVAGLVVKFTSQVVDGTSCSHDDNPKVCVKGQCETLGCDFKLDSSAIFDRCGVCNGDGSSCELVSGSISQVLYSGYRNLLALEIGSRNINIRQASGPEATVAVKSSDGIFFLNDVNRRVRLAGTRNIASTVMYYDQSQNGGTSSLRIKGPISEQLDILGFTLEAYSNINFEYEFFRSTATSGGDVIDPMPQEESDKWQTLLRKQMSPVDGFSSVPDSTDHNVTRRNISSHLSDTDNNNIRAKTVPETDDVNLRTMLEGEATHPDKTVAASRAKIRKRTLRKRKLKLRKSNAPKYLPENTGSRTSENRARGIGIGISVRSGTRQEDNTEGENNVYPRRARSGYEWRKNPITQCSSTCTIGTQINLFNCERQDGVKVNDSFCDVSLRPSPTYHECGRERCQPRWVTGPWAPCSRTCGGGESVRSVRCWQMLAPGFDSTVHAYLCDIRAEPSSSRRCGEIPCGPQWEVSSWQECSTKCGNGFQVRHVKCSSGSDVYCPARSRPSHQRSCNLASCTNQWYTVSWSPCSGPCGRGTRQRHVGCRDSQGRLQAETYCDPNTKPLSTIACGESLYCPPTWVAQPWGTCNLDCGTGEVSREVRCGSVVGGKFRLQSDVNCKRSPRPKLITSCLVEECQAMWFTTTWSECSETCGNDAVKTRDVRCFHGNHTSNRCNTNDKPLTTERCKLRPCPEQEDDLCDSDRIENCHLLVADLCKQAYYKSQCCVTCRRKTGETEP
ncbi:ADAMTS-like protein 2 [Argopecten irradians]|uniref:ADAMTS-like protein 2 n=1 Tax=Argopecten irradians TaxID=31199 RepID=UPI003724AA5C